MIVISTQLIRPFLCIHHRRFLFFLFYSPSNIMCVCVWGWARPCNYICCLNMWNLLWYSRCSTLFFHNRRRRRHHRCSRWYNSNVWCEWIDKWMDSWMGILNRLLFGHLWYAVYMFNTLCTETVHVEFFTHHFGWIFSSVVNLQPLNDVINGK